MASTSPGFVHLHVHSSYSLREGALTVAKLAKLAAADRMPALAITDTNNLFGALEFSEKLAKEGIQPIIGLQLAVDFGDAAALGGRFDLARVGRAPIVLLAQSEAGYANLMRIASQAFLDPQPGDPAGLDSAGCREGVGGLIALTGGPSGPLDTLLRLGRAGGRRGAALASPRDLRPRPALHRTAAARARRGAPDRAAAHRPRLPARHPARRHQRAVLREPVRSRGA